MATAVSSKGASKVSQSMNWCDGDEFRRLILVFGDQFYL